MSRIKLLFDLAWVAAIAYVLVVKVLPALSQLTLLLNSVKY